MQFQYQSLLSKLKETTIAKDKAIENLCKSNFTLINIQRENNCLIKKYEDALAQVESSILTLKYNKDK